MVFSRTRFSTPLSLTESLAGVYLDAVPDTLLMLELHFGKASMHLTWSRNTLMELRGRNLLQTYFDGPIPSCLSKDEPPMLRWTTEDGDSTVPDHRVEYTPCTETLDGGDEVVVPIRSFPGRLDETIKFVCTHTGRKVVLSEYVYYDDIPVSAHTMTLTKLDANNSLVGLFVDDVPDDLVSLEFTLANVVLQVKWSKNELIEKRGTNLLSVYFDEPIPVYLAKDKAPLLYWTKVGGGTTVPDFRVEYDETSQGRLVAGETYEMLMRGWTRCEESDTEYFDKLRNELSVNPRRIPRDGSNKYVLCDNMLVFQEGTVGMKYYF